MLNDRIEPYLHAGRLWRARRRRPRVRASGRRDRPLLRRDRADLQQARVFVSVVRGARGFTRHARGRAQRARTPPLYGATETGPVTIYQRIADAGVYWCRAAVRRMADGASVAAAPRISRQ